MLNETDTVCMTPLEKGSTCRKYLTHNIHKRDLNICAGRPTEFEPTIPISERPKPIS